MKEEGGGGLGGGCQSTRSAEIVNNTPRAGFKPGAFEITRRELYY